MGNLRKSRPETTGFAQASYLALLEPDDPGDVTRVEREAIGLRVATLERSQVVADFHTGRLLALGEDEAFIAAITDFPEGSPVRTDWRRFCGMSISCPPRRGVGRKQRLRHSARPVWMRNRS